MQEGMIEPSEAIPSERTQPSAVDFAALKSRQQAMWASGDFAVIGNTLQIVGETLCEAVDLEAGSRVLDVACGNGNAALAAARRFCNVTGLDYVPALLRGAAERARAEHVALELVHGDAERLPFEVGAFDVALSTFGVMFAPDQQSAAREARTRRAARREDRARELDTRRIRRAAAEDRGQARAAAAGRGVARLLGVEGRLRDLFPEVRSTSRDPSGVRVPLRVHGPFHRYLPAPLRAHAQAFGALDTAGQAALAADIAALAATFNRRPSSFAVAGEYLEVVIER